MMMFPCMSALHFFFFIRLSARENELSVHFTVEGFSESTFTWVYHGRIEMVRGFKCFCCKRQHQPTLVRDNPVHPALKEMRKEALKHHSLAFREFKQTLVMATTYCRAKRPFNCSQWLTHTFFVTAFVHCTYILSIFCVRHVEF